MPRGWISKGNLFGTITACYSIVRLRQKARLSRRAFCLSRYGVRSHAVHIGLAHPAEAAGGAVHSLVPVHGLAHDGQQLAHPEGADLARAGAGGGAEVHPAAAAGGPRRDQETRVEGNLVE